MVPPAQTEVLGYKRAGSVYDTGIKEIDQNHLDGDCWGIGFLG